MPIYPPSTGGGSGWLPTEPTAAQFTVARNGTGMTAATKADLTKSPGIMMTFSRNSTASNWRQSYFLQSVGGGVPFRAEALISNPLQSSNDFIGCGLAISTDNAADVERSIRISDLVSASLRYAPYSVKHTTLNGQEALLTTINQPTQLLTSFNNIWFAIEYDGTNINTYVSFDGYTWYLNGTEPKAFFTGTPNLVGFGWEAVASDGGTQYVFCPHFKITTNLNDPFGLNNV